ncbi:MAG: MBL fold metallo-hydrolase [bacterium]|nr:MBL fold metallo-hydrolase [bacterium]
MTSESKIFILICLIGLSACSFVNRNSNSQKTTIHFIDVGEGAATLIDSPELGRILIDTGNPGSKIVSKLRSLGVHKINILILTHPHPDHIGGVYPVLEFMDPDLIFDNGELLDRNKPEERWYLEHISGSSKFDVLRAGDKFEGKNSKLEILAPFLLEKDWNTNSIVIKFTAYDSSVLLMADGNYASEEKLLNKGLNLDADILQVGHHGAQDATSNKFLMKVSPQYAVISVNTDNINGYPSKKTIRRVKESGTKVLLTSDSGTISFRVAPLGIELITPAS